MSNQVETSSWSGRRCVALAAFVVAVGFSGGGVHSAFAGTFGEYKDEKHDSSGSNSGSSSSSSADDSDSDDDSDDGTSDSFWDIFAGDEDDDDEYEASETEQRVRYASRPCHYPKYRRCMSECDSADSRCHTKCRARTNAICGAPYAYGAGTSSPGAIPSGGTRADGSRVDVDGRLGGGFGIVNGAGLATGEGFVGWGRLGIGGQFSAMWNPEEMLFETDFGPRIYTGAEEFRTGFQPSLMLSAADDVDTLLGVGLRTSLHAEHADWFVDARPLIGYIGSNLNVHTRTGLGYYVGDDVYFEIGHDYRFVHGLSGGGGVGLHGGFLAVGTGH